MHCAVATEQATASGSLINIEFTTQQVNMFFCFCYVFTHDVFRELKVSSIMV